MTLLRNAAVAFLFTLVVASTAFAAVSPQYQEWRNGGVQWIMTSAEKNAWKQVKSDEEAVKFIDLFWARRDPTPGTPQNAARDEFDARAKLANEKFSEPKKLGVLTDRGRAWIVLGPPPNKTELMGRVSSGGAPLVSGGPASGGGGRSQGGDTPTGSGSDPARGRQMGARDQWIWEHDQAVAQFGLPRVEVVFVTDPITHRTIRDIFRRDFAAAEAAALRKQIVTDYKELPDWAPFGGLTPRIHASAAQPASQQAGPADAAPSQPALVPVPGTGPVMAPRGASRLVLSKDVYGVDLESENDPLAKIQATAMFKLSDELGWAAQYCAETTKEPSVTFLLRITGNIGGTPVDRATPPDDMVPDRIKSSPGCYMLRGSIPIDDMDLGRYKLELMIDDPIVKADSYTLAGEFTIQ